MIAYWKYPHQNGHSSEGSLGRLDRIPFPGLNLEENGTAAVEAMNDRLLYVCICLEAIRDLDICTIYIRERTTNVIAIL